MFKDNYLLSYAFKNSGHLSFQIFVVQLESQFQKIKIKIKMAPTNITQVGEC